MKSAVSVRLLFGAAATLITVGCSTTPKESNPQDFMKPQDTIAEYKAEAATLVLAPRWTWPQQPDIDAVGPDGKPMFYQRGYGKMSADWYWYCSWGRSYLYQEQPDPMRTEAFTQMLKIRDLYYYRSGLLPQDRPSFDRVLVEAERGDTAALQNSIDINCPSAAN